MHDDDGVSFMRQLLCCRVRNEDGGLLTVEEMGSLLCNTIEINQWGFGS